MAVKSEELPAESTWNEPYKYMTSQDHVHRGDVTSAFALFYTRSTMHGMENLGKARGKFFFSFQKACSSLTICNRVYLVSAGYTTFVLKVWCMCIHYI